MKIATVMKLLYDRVKIVFRKYPDRRPRRPIPVEKLNLKDMLPANDSKAVWFGHSTVFMQIEGKTVLCDPIFSNLFWFFTLFTGRRFTKQLPLAPREFPDIDILLLSHDHYDHMDYSSIMALKDKVRLFCVPRGLGARLRRWGVGAERIAELAYGDEVRSAGLTCTCTPNRHFSGRGLFDRNKTLWCSWVISGKKTTVFFSGDGAYGPHFEKIGRKYGPFDLTFMECGQANANFSHIHMTPEKAAQAHIDLQGRLMVPIHWGLFSQSNNEWTRQIERLLAAAEHQKIKVATPKIGEVVTIGAEAYPCSLWWRKAGNAD